MKLTTEDATEIKLYCKEVKKIDGKSGRLDFKIGSTRLCIGHISFCRLIDDLSQNILF